MKVKTRILISLFFVCSIAVAQTITGVVLDAKTNTPIETAAVYFDNTTLGVITNSKGEFSIRYSKAIKSPLIVSFLGYEKQIINNYRDNNKLTVQLEESHESLNEVIVNADDGLTRKQKLRFFRKEFLGTSRFGNSCTILNEDDIIIRYNKKEKIITAYSKVPLKIQNSALQYLVSYDLTSFVLKFHRTNPNGGVFDVKSVGFFGNTYYSNFKIFNKQKAIKNREKVYQGSRLQFMRALYKYKLEDNRFEIYDMTSKVDPWKYFKIETKNSSEIKRVYLNQPLNILFKNREKSRIEFLTPFIYIDSYGNYTDVDKILFSGAMGEQRIGELLPFDYRLEL